MLRVRKHVGRPVGGYLTSVNPPSAPTATRLANVVASATGGLLAGAARTLGRVRPSTKPLHPTGDVVTGSLVRSGRAPRSGVRWLDAAGTDEVLVRVSRAVGLPEALPDIHGIALRVPVHGGHGDLLLASTGLGRATRFLLLPSRDLGKRPLTTLLPYRGPDGPLFLGCRPAGDGPDGQPPSRYDLLWSNRLGDWVEFARLELAATTGPDPTISFDPIANPLPGLPPYGWVRRLRQPAYRAARESSGRSPRG